MRAQDFKNNVKRRPVCNSVNSFSCCYLGNTEHTLSFRSFWRCSLGWTLLFSYHIYWIVTDRDEQPVAHNMSMNGFSRCSIILSLLGFFQFSLEEFQEIKWILSQLVIQSPSHNSKALHNHPQEPMKALLKRDLPLMGLKGKNKKKEEKRAFWVVTP